jgi:hypothetical protein
MNSNLESVNRGELELTDWARLAGLLIFVAFICFSIVLFGNGANPLVANQTQSIAQTSTPVARLEAHPASTPVALPQSVAAAVPEAETRSESAPSSGEPVSPSLQEPPGRMVTEKSAVVKGIGASAIRKHRMGSVMRRQASRRRSVIDKVVLRSVNAFVEMWHHAFKTNK